MYLLVYQYSTFYGNKSISNNNMNDALVMIVVDNCLRKTFCFIFVIRGGWTTWMELVESSQLWVVAAVVVVVIVVTTACCGGWCGADQGCGFGTQIVRLRMFDEVRPWDLKYFRLQGSCRYVSTVTMKWMLGWIVSLKIDSGVTDGFIIYWHKLVMLMFYAR